MMFGPLFKTLRLSGFLPYTYNCTDKSYQISEKWHFWTYLIHGGFILTSIWRIYYYTITVNLHARKSFIYEFLLTYEPLIDVIYILFIIHPVLVRRKIKKLQKCLNLLEEIRLEETNRIEKCIFYVVIFIVLTVAVTVELILRPCNSSHTIDDHFDYNLYLVTTFILSFSLMHHCIYYCVLFYRLKLIRVQLENVKQMSRMEQKTQLKPLINSYSKCVSLIKTFDHLNFFSLRNVWLHCVFDLLCTYLGGRLFLRRFMNGEGTKERVLADIVASLWNIYNAPLAFFLITWGNRVQEQVLTFIIQGSNNY